MLLLQALKWDTMLRQSAYLIEELQAIVSGVTGQVKMEPQCLIVSSGFLLLLKDQKPQPRFNVGEVAGAPLLLVSLEISSTSSTTTFGCLLVFPIVTACFSKDVKDVDVKSGVYAHATTKVWRLKKTTLVALQCDLITASCTNNYHQVVNKQLVCDD